jgi:hypothetical protein
MKKRIIIEQEWGGLGDNLQFSTLPEIGSKLGYDVYISNHNKYRNLDIKRLVWDINPFISGYTDERGNLNDLFSPNPINKDFPILDRWDNNLNIIQNIEFQIFGKFYNENPILYYRPNLLNDFFDKILVDSNTASTNFNFDSIIDNIDKENLILLNQERSGFSNKKSNSIFEWIDMITSAKEFICQLSGGTVVMAAYNKPCTVYTTTDNTTFNFKIHNYIKI